MISYNFSWNGEKGNSCAYRFFTSRCCKFVSALQLYGTLAIKISQEQRKLHHLIANLVVFPNMALEKIRRTRYRYLSFVLYLSFWDFSGNQTKLFLAKPAEHCQYTNSRNFAKKLTQLQWLFKNSIQKQSLVKFWNIACPEVGVLENILLNMWAKSLKTIIEGIKGSKVTDL